MVVDVRTCSGGFNLGQKKGGIRSHERVSYTAYLEENTLHEHTPKHATGKGMVLKEDKAVDGGCQSSVICRYSQDGCS